MAMNRFTGSGRLTLAVLTVGVLALGACTDDDAGGEAAVEPTSTTARPEATTTSVDSAGAVEAEVVDAYQAASDAFLDAAAVPDPDFPALLATHVGPMLNQRRGVLTELKFEGRVIRLPANSIYEIEAESVELRGADAAVLRVCIVDDGERYDAATGELLTDGRPGTSRFQAALRRVEGRWVLAEQLLQEEWPGVSGCATD